MYVCMYVCVCVCVYVCMYVCVCVHMCVCVSVCLAGSPASAVAGCADYLSTARSQACLGPRSSPRSARPKTHCCSYPCRAAHCSRRGSTPRANHLLRILPPCPTLAFAREHDTAALRSGPLLALPAVACVKAVTLGKGVLQICGDRCSLLPPAGGIAPNMRCRRRVMELTPCGAELQSLVG